MGLLRAQWAKGKFLCVGLDSDFEKIPESARRGGNERDVDIPNTVVAFNRAIVEVTKDVVCAYKPNSAFYEAHGDEGFAALHRTIGDIHAIAPDVPVILDAKRDDIGATSVKYAKTAFDVFGADAVTVNPYLGQDAIQPFLDRKEKGIIVLCRTSNPGAGEFQDVRVAVKTSGLRDLLQCEEADEKIITEPCIYRENRHLPLYQYVALRVLRHWNANGNCMLVAGATHPEELAQIRRLAPDMPLLIPGIGKQGGDVEATVKAGMDSRGAGMIINASSSVIFASKGEDFAEAAGREAKRLHDLIAACRKKGGAA